MPKPLISLVTGTYNRMAYVQAMCRSFTSQIPRHVPYEIVLCDGGSADGTLEWAKAQPYTVLIEHGELRGAIKAFDDAARASVGDYVIMANDDILFRPFSVMRAVAYLEDHRDCGCVAFADNRAAQLGHANAHRVEQAPGLLPDGQLTMLNYAQVGMWRKWLGELIGWWGDEDEIMSGAKTYGGDNFLSSRSWELGYTVDAVEGCMIDDQIARDDLRVANNVSGKRDSELYYLRYPQGPRYPGAPQVANPQPERLRILCCPIYEQRYPAAMNKEYGLTEAFANVGLTYEVDYVSEDTYIPDVVKTWQPDLMFVQIQGVSKKINAHMLSVCRQACPTMAVVAWNGDAHRDGLTSPEIVECLRQVDLQTVTNAGVLPDYEALGIRAAFWQIAWKQPIEPLPDAPKHPVVFLGNCYSPLRDKLVDAIRTIPDAGIYGNCSGSLGNTHYDFAMSAAIYQNAKIAISDTFPDTRGFVSNRMLQAMGAGVLVLQQYSPDLDRLMGFCAGTHYVQWNTIEELPALMNDWLKGSRRKERERIAKAGQSFIRENYNYDRQVERLFELL